MVLCAGPEQHFCQASKTELMLPLVSYIEGAWMRLHLERSVSKAGAVTCATEPGLVNTPLTLSSCTSAAFELMFIAEIFSAMSLAPASGSPTAAPPNRVGTENTLLLLPQAHATCWSADNCLVDFQWCPCHNCLRIKDGTCQVLGLQLRWRATVRSQPLLGSPVLYWASH